MMSDRAPLSRSRATVFLAAGVLLVLIGMRNTIAVRPLESALEQALESETGRSVSVTVARLSGSWWADLRMHDVSVSVEGPRPVGFTASALEVRYSLRALAGREPMEGLHRLGVTGGEIRLSFAGVPPAHPSDDPPVEDPMVAVLQSYPHHLELDAELGAVIELPGDNAVRGRTVLSGSSRDGLRVSVSAPGSQVVLPWIERLEADMIVTAAPDRLVVASTGRIGEHPLEMDLDLSLHPHAGLVGRAELTGKTESFTVDAAVDEESAAVLLVYDPPQPGRPWVVPVLPEPSFPDEDIVLTGAMVEAEYSLHEGEAHRVIDLLRSEPGRLPEKGEIAVSARVDGATVAGASGIDAELEARSVGSVLEISRLLVDVNGKATVEAGGRFDPRSRIVSDAHVLMRATELPEAAREMLESAGWDGALDGHLFADVRVRRVEVAEDFAVAWESADGDIAVQATSVVIDGIPVRKVELEATVAEGTVDLSQLLGRVDNLAVDASGRADLVQRLVSDARLAFDVSSLADLPAHVPIMPPWIPPMEGRAAVEMLIQELPFPAEPAEALQTSRADIAVRASSLHVDGIEVGDVDVDASLREGRIDVSPLAVRGEEIRMAATGTLSPRAGGVGIEVTNALVTIRGTAAPTFEFAEPMIVDVSARALLVTATTIETAGGRFTVEGRLDPDGVHFLTTAPSYSIGDALAMAGISAPVSGSVSWRVQVSGRLGDPRVTAVIQTRDALVEGDPFEVSADVRLLGPQDISISLVGASESLTGILPDDLQPYLPSRDLRFELTAHEVDGRTVGEVSATASHPDPAQGDETHGYRRADLSAQFAETPGDRLELTGGIDLDDEPAVTWDGRVAVPGLADRSPEWTAEDVDVDLSLELDLPVGYPAAYLTDLALAAGRIRGAGQVQGPLAGPALTGSVTVHQGELRLVGPVPAVSAVNARFEFHDGMVTVDFLDGEFGRAPFSAHGSVRLPELGSEGEIDVQLTGDNLLLYTGPEIRARADAALLLTGQFTGPEITGELVVQDVEYSEHMPLVDLSAPPAVDPGRLQLFSVDAEFADATTLDVAVRADRTIVVRNNVLDATFSMDARLAGTLEVPFLVGSVISDAGRVRLPLTTIDLRQVVVEFPAATPFEPSIDASGTSRIRGYEVFVHASGTFGLIELDVSSNPMLPRDQVILLLTTGQPDLADLAAGERLVRTLGEYVGRQLVEVLFGDTDVEREVLDRFDVVVGRQISETGSEVLEVEFRLDRDRNWFVSFERDRYDDINVGVLWRLSFD